MVGMVRPLHLAKAMTVEMGLLEEPQITLVPVVVAVLAVLEQMLRAMVVTVEPHNHQQSLAHP